MIFILGNHDLFYRDKLELHSLPYITQFPNITLIDSMQEIAQVAFVPWLVSDDWKRVPNLRAPYMFGHFELPRFKMNAMVEMPDHGGLNTGHFPNQEMVFSGHFHLRQSKGNVHYTGNAFPHNFADAWDDDRGMMILENGKDPIYLSWPNAPKYRLMKLSELLTNPELTLQPNTYVRVDIDIETSFEEANFIKETFMTQYNLRELSLTQGKQGDVLGSEGIDVVFESVDQIVTKQIASIDSEFYDSKLLLDIYKNL